jgi:long-subunit fatty acid transport protein
MKKIVVIALLIFSVSVKAQVYPQLGARANGLAGAVLGQNDIWSVYNNPGAFGALEKSGVGVSYENRFLLKEMSTQSLVFGYHTENAGNFGIHFQQYGFNLYREIQGGISYGMKFYDNFSGGISLNYHRIALGENYGNKNTFSAALGLMYDMNDQLTFGMRVLNINRARLTDVEDERLPTTFSLGVLYNFSEKAFWSLEAEKDLIHPLNIRSGIEVRPHEVFAVRLGMTTYPFQASFGFGLKFKNFHLDMASLWHTQLGLSPSAGLHYEF